MATLIKYMRPRIKNSIEESEAKMEVAINWKIEGMHRRIDAFKLKLIERPQSWPSVDLTTFQT